MKMTVVAAPRAGHQAEHQTAMARGLAAHGIEPVLSIGGPVATHHVACWGWRTGKALRAAGHEVLVMERGYLGDRFAWTSLAWNGLNNRGDFGNVPNDGGERFAQNFSLQPWKEGGEWVLLLGQVPGDASLQGKDLGRWYTRAAMAANNAYEMPVLFRQHPRAAAKGFHQEPHYTHQAVGTLESALARSAVAICWNSNAAVDAVISGVPAVTMDEGAMAWDVTAHRIGDIARPARETWAARLAWKQWKLTEIESGFALEGLLAKEAA